MGINIKVSGQDCSRFIQCTEVQVYEPAHQRFIDLHDKVNDQDIIDNCKYIIVISYGEDSSETLHILTDESITIDGTTYVGV